LPNIFEPAALVVVLTPVGTTTIALRVRMNSAGSYQANELVKLLVRSTPDTLITDLPKATNTTYLKSAGMVRLAIADAPKSVKGQGR